jgi:phage-related protein
VPVTILFYREGEVVPVLDWLTADPNATAQVRCLAAIDRLARQGHDARRPLVENLGRGIYELRVRVGRQNYGMLFFFFGRTAVVLTGGFTKEPEVANGDRSGVARKAVCEEHPELTVEVEL